MVSLWGLHSLLTLQAYIYVLESNWVLFKLRFKKMRFTTSGNINNWRTWKPPFVLDEPKSVSWKWKMSPAFLHFVFSFPPSFFPPSVPPYFLATFLPAFGAHWFDLGSVVMLQVLLLLVILLLSLSKHRMVSTRQRRGSCAWSTGKRLLWK